MRNEKLQETLSLNRRWRNNETEYNIYLSCADDGNGGDVTNNGEPLKTFDEWLNS